jgi:3-hydroxybutyryl-CoA dehydrogenase
MGGNTAGIAKAAVVGSGFMGGGIAQTLALAGVEIVLADVDAEKAEAARSRLVDEARNFEAAGLMDAGAARTINARLSAAPTIEDAVAGVDYVTEAVFESRPVKFETLGRLGRAAGPGTVIGTNTSAIPIEELADQVEHPERFLGVHWMNPAPFVPGVELIPSSRTRADVIARAEALVKAAGKTPATVQDIPGFVANRLQFALFKEAAQIVAEGAASPAQVDQVVSNTFGFRLAIFGPFAIGDMAGLDVYAGAYETLAAAYGQRMAVPASLAAKVAAGQLGLKTGAGYRTVDPAQREALVAYRSRAYRELSRLKTELGPPPGLGTPSAGTPPPPSDQRRGR